MKTGIDYQLDLQDSESEKTSNPETHMQNQMLAAKQANSAYGIARGYFERNIALGLNKNGASAFILAVIPVIVGNNKKHIHILKNILSAGSTSSKPLDAGEIADQLTTIRNSNDQAWSVIFDATGLALGGNIQCSTFPGGLCNRLGLTTSHRLELSRKLANIWGDGVRQLASSRSVVDAAAAQIYNVVHSTGYQSIDGTYLPGVEPLSTISTATYKYVH